MHRCCGGDCRSLRATVELLEPMRRWQRQDPSSTHTNRTNAKRVISRPVRFSRSVAGFTLNPPRVQRSTICTYGGIHYPRVERSATVDIACLLRQVSYFTKQLHKHGRLIMNFFAIFFGALSCLSHCRRQHSCSKSIPMLGNRDHIPRFRTTFSPPSCLHLCHSFLGQGIGKLG